MWVGGLPDLLVASADGTIRTRLPSLHMPLGILSAKHFETRVQTIELQPGERVFLSSDGICDCANVEGEMFEEARLEALFDGATPAARLFDKIRDASSRYIDGQP